ncbi:hypothetical protein THIAE_08835 [Thiomicrospira aerophila AL3]|uniref:J domain-containing protein n=1 Tax=Thiomicrospira aerophila AL3 TaxID=717772 RepID=W0DYM0_9GAMM|nr:DNA-J related domain-containing protein [Thiomicrospira aerophila]AHF02368.1 hypothetical protein THIAE_08835 [Thiomicrospira aerophila AL3]
MQTDQLDPQLLNDLLTLLLQHPDGIAEHQLLKALAEQGYQAFQPSLEPLALFQAHFLLFHLLYRQQQAWYQQGHGWLQIDCLKIQFQPQRPHQPTHDTQSTPPQLDDPLRRYYLDIEQYRQTQTDDVIELLDSFWRSLARSPDTTQIQQAKGLLEITEETITLEQVNRHYRRLSQIHHPDKGGDSERFRQISQAAETLRKSLGYKKT